LKANWKLFKSTTYVSLHLSQLPYVVTGLVIHLSLGRFHIFGTHTPVKSTDGLHLYILASTKQHLLEEVVGLYSCFSNIGTSRLSASMYCLHVTQPNSSKFFIFYSI